MEFAVIVFLYGLLWLLVPVLVARRSGSAEDAKVAALCLVPLAGWILGFCVWYVVLVEDQAKTGQQERLEHQEPDRNSLLRPAGKEQHRG